jgi:hypothetical protein
VPPAQGERIDMEFRNPLYNETIRELWQP